MSKIYDVNGNEITGTGGVEPQHNVNMRILTALNPQDGRVSSPTAETAKHKYFSIAFQTDVHADRPRLERLKNLVNHANGSQLYSYFDCVILGGDTMHCYRTETEGTIYNGIATGGTSWIAGDTQGFLVPLIATIGNHDTGFTTGIDCYGDDACHDIYFNNTVLYNNSKKPYGYYDFIEYGIRVISIYNFDSGLMEVAKSQGLSVLPCRRGFATIYSQAQLDWLATTLNSVPSGYKVIVVSHTAPLYREANLTMLTPFTDEDMTLTNWAKESYAAQSYRTSDGGGMGVIADIIQAWRDKTTISATYNYSGNNWWSSSLSYWNPVTANYDFTNANGSFGFYLCGHRHADAAVECNMTGYTGQRLISADVGSMENYQRCSSKGRVRALNSVNQDNILGLVVNTTSNKVYAVNIGADRDMSGSDKVLFEMTMG